LSFFRRDQSLPAFGACSLDASPGDGDHADAEKSGGINLHQRWDPETIVDEPSRWEASMYLQECREGLGVGGDDADFPLEGLVAVTKDRAHN